MEYPNAGGMADIVTRDFNPGWLRSIALTEGDFLQSAKARLQWIDSIQFYSTTRNMLKVHPFQPDLSDCKSIRFIP
jgi:hypothetical protein